MIECENPTINIDSIQHLKIKAIISNNGTESINLVKPGDGSQNGWRTPIIKWSVVKSDTEQPQSTETNFLENNNERCGNVNGLTADDLVELPHGESVEFKYWLGTPAIPNASGQYKIRMLYANEPKLKWKGLGMNDKEVMRKVKRTNSLELISNEILIEVER